MGMSTADLVVFASVWYTLRVMPGLLQFIGFIFGFLLASWFFDEHFWGG
jgi:hypothetical protein